MAEIRKATAADAEKILAYCKIVGEESDNLTFGEEGVPFTVVQEREYLDKIFKSERDLYLVAVDEEDVVGTMSFSSYERPRLAHRGEIAVSVKKSMWGNHIGTRFMEAMIDFAKHTAKVEIVSLEVRSDNERAIALYKKFGFETIGTFRGFLKINGQDVDCDIMQLHL